MSWISIILLIIKYGPALFTLVTEIIELIKRLRHPTEQSHFKAELEDAVRYYRETKDRGPLRALREKLQRRCFGPDCKPAA